MGKDRLDDLAESLKQMRGALLTFEATANECYPNASKMSRLESERQRQQDRANNEACLRGGQDDCLRRLGLYIAAGARLCWGDNGDIDCKFYLFNCDGNGIAAGNTMQELISNIPRGE